MSWDYETKLKSYIVQAQNDSGMTDYLFEVCDEQIFVKKKTLDPKTIYVVVKYLSSTNTLNAVTQPIQILVSCEQNQIQASQIVFSKLVDSHNFEAVIDGGTYIKQDYRQPVVLSNFNEVSYGYRTLMYISATLFIMENVMDVKNLVIKTGRLKTLNTEETNVKDDWFNGEIGDIKDSPVYVLRIRELLSDFSYYEIEGEIGLTSKYDDIGAIKVNNVLCSTMIFTSSGYVLKDASNNLIVSKEYGNDLYISIQFMAGDGNEFVSGFINEIDYKKIFPDAVYLKNMTGPVLPAEESVKPINFNISYSMTPNTQPIPPQLIATSVKSVSTFSLTFTVPMINYNFLNITSYIMDGKVSGNTTFGISFDVGSIHYETDMKLVSAQITTAIDQVPGIQIGLIK